MKLSCFCRPVEEIVEPAWITAHGFSHAGDNALSFAIGSGLFEQRDRFGHTLLHLMAARFMRDHLFQTILSDQEIHILNAQNTAGQTLLHVLHASWFQPHNQFLLQQLLDILAQKGFDSVLAIITEDHSHISFFSETPQPNSETICSSYAKLQTTRKGTPLT
jgi:hypothetical protein